MIAALESESLLEELKDELSRCGMSTDLASEDLREAVLDEVVLTDELWVTEDESVLLAETLVDGVKLTHRLTEAEAAAEKVVTTSDLDLLDWDVDEDDLRLLDGRPLQLLLDDPLFERWQMGLGGPPGWLGGARGGDVVAFTRVARRIDVDVLASGPAAGERELEAMRRAIAARLQPGGFSEPTEILMDALATDPGAFREPVLPVGELLVKAGLESKGPFYGRVEEDWKSPAELLEAGARRQLAGELEQCCRSRFERVCDAYTAFRDGGPVDGPAVLDLLRHGGVVAAFASYANDLGSSTARGLVGFASELVAVGRRHGPALYLLGHEAEERGDVLEAEGFYQSALKMDPQLAMAAEACSRLAIDRGEFRRAITLLSHDGLNPDDPVLEMVRELVAPPRELAGVGRNDPCPCGSGRKYKQCHLGRSPTAADNPFRTAPLKLALFSLRLGPRAVVNELAAAAADPDDPNLDMAIGRYETDPVVMDFAWWEGGIALQYLDERGELLPPDERELIATMLAESRKLWEVTGVEPDVWLDLRDTKTGRAVHVEERSGSREAATGDLLLARVVQWRGKSVLAGDGLRVQLHQRQSMMELLDSAPSAEDFAWWYGTATAMPRLSNREGDDLVFCSATLDAHRSELEISAALDGAFQREEDDESGTPVWVEVVEPANHDKVIASFIRLRSGTIELETNSRERLDRLLASLRVVLPTVEVIERGEKDGRRMMLEHQSRDAGEELGPATSPEAAPEMRAMLEELVRQKEREWVDEQIPVLGGLTPRQALEDPTRREDLIRLLREIADRNTASSGGEGGFKADRLRALLGLEGSA